ncbi:MAG: RNA 2',3'-cyclic phosphodiesterase [Candidatus Melainabacteria bacterium]|nr:RNA 2',3'-cyclic phosphodiesterase [Candidatus Melainabacteria bacterium]
MTEAKSGTTTDVARLFIGSFLSLDQQQLLGLFQEHNDRLTALWQYKLRWVKPIKMHLTWLFLGNVKAMQVDSIVKPLKTITARYASMELVYNNCEFWPSPSKPRQLVLTPRSTPPEAAKIGADIKACLAHIAAKEDRHTFCPHITLLRLEPAHNQQHLHVSRQALEIPVWFNLNKVLPVQQTISSICLVESHVGKGANDYTIIETFLLNQH